MASFFLGKLVKRVITKTDYHQIINYHQISGHIEFKNFGSVNECAVYYTVYTLQYSNYPPARANQHA